MLSSGKKAAVLMVVEEVEVFLVKKGNKEKREGFFLSTFGSLLSLSFSLVLLLSFSLVPPCCIWSNRGGKRDGIKVREDIL